MSADTVTALKNLENLDLETQAVNGVMACVSKLKAAALPNTPRPGIGARLLHPDKAEQMYIKRNEAANAQLAECARAAVHLPLLTEEVKADLRVSIERAKTTEAAMKGLLTEDKLIDLKTRIINAYFKDNNLGNPDVLKVLDELAYPKRQ